MHQRQCNQHLISGFYINQEAVFGRKDFHHVNIRGLPGYFIPGKLQAISYEALGLKCANHLPSKCWF
jgi:hypothetical protein